MSLCVAVTPSGTPRLIALASTIGWGGLICLIASNEIGLHLKAGVLAVLFRDVAFRWLLLERLGCFDLTAL